jgi:hypothetical protein
LFRSCVRPQEPQDGTRRCASCESCCRSALRAPTHSREGGAHHRWRIWHRRRANDGQ